MAVRTSDNEPCRFWGECVLGLEVWAGDLAFPKAVIEGDIHLEDLEAAIPEAGLSGPLVFPGIKTDRLKKKWETHIKMTKIIIFKSYISHPRYYSTMKPQSELTQFNAPAD